MSNTFNTQALAGQRVLVTGDVAEQRTILDAAEWNEVKHLLAHTVADEVFNAAVEEFFAPLVEVAEAAAQELQATLPKPDEAFTIVIDEGAAGTEAVEPVVINLGRDAAILRMIEEGQTDRLIWVGDTIEILAS